MARSISALESTHEVSKFSCGRSELDTYLREIARQHQKKNLSKTYVMTDDAFPATVIGYFTMTIRHPTPKEEMPPELVKRLPTMVPGFTLARLAVSDKHQRNGHGEELLLTAMGLAKSVAEKVGGFALFVDAKDQEASLFYQKYGFTPFPSDPLILVIPISHMP